MKKAKSYNMGLLQDAIVKWKGYKSQTEIRNQDIYEFGIFIGHPHNPYENNRLIIDTSKQEVQEIIDLINGERGDVFLKIIAAQRMDHE